MNWGAMHSLNRAIVVALITFGASLVGMALQWVVPADVLTASKGSVGAMVGLVTLFLALVLGLLVFTAFSVFTTQRDEAYSLGPLVAEVDLALELYGPEAARGRAGLLAALRRSRARFFGDSERGPQPFTFEVMRAIFLSQNGFFDRLKPETETQRGLLEHGEGSGEKARRHADADGAPARQSVPAACSNRGGLMGLGALSRQWPRRGAQCGELAGAFRWRGLDRDRDLSHPRTEPSLYRPDPTFAGRD